MNHDTRGRLSVDINGPWRIYTNHLPVGATAIGHVTSNGETGALVRLPTGIYVRINAGALTSLPQSKVRGAINAVRK